MSDEFEHRYLPVPDALVDTRVDVALSRMLGMSRSQAGDLVSAGHVRINGAVSRKSDRLSLQDLIEVDIPQHRVQPAPVTGMDILYDGSRGLCTMEPRIQGIVQHTGHDQFAASCAQRLERGTSPSRRTDEMVTRLAAKYVGDPGIIVAFLMNPVSLRPGEAVYIPPRQIDQCQKSGSQILAQRVDDAGAAQ